MEACGGGRGLGKAMENVIKEVRDEKKLELTITELDPFTTSMEVL